MKKEYHHIVATIRKDKYDVKWLCTSPCFVKPIHKGSEIFSEDDGEYYVTKCVDISANFYHFSDGSMYVKTCLPTKEPIMVICDEYSGKISRAFMNKMSSLESGTKLLLETEDDNMTLKTRKDGTYIIHPYTTEAKLYDALSDVREFINCPHPDIKRIYNYVNEILDENEIEYY